jgi:hypothetical protein
MKRLVKYITNAHPSVGAAVIMGCVVIALAAFLMALHYGPSTGDAVAFLRKPVSELRVFEALACAVFVLWLFDSKSNS